MPLIFVRATVLGAAVSVLEELYAVLILIKWPVGQISRQLTDFEIYPTDCRHLVTDNPQDRRHTGRRSCRLLPLLDTQPKLVRNWDSSDQKSLVDG